MVKIYRYIVAILFLLLTGFVVYKYYQFDRFFQRDDFKELSQLHNGTLRTLYLNGMINEIEDSDYKEYLFELNQFNDAESSFFQEQFYFRKFINAENGTTYTVGLKGEDYQVGGRKYYYLGQENLLDVSSASFLKYLFKNNNYDIILSEMIDVKTASTLD